MSETMIDEILPSSTSELDPTIQESGIHNEDEALEYLYGKDSENEDAMEDVSKIRQRKMMDFYDNVNNTNNNGLVD